LSRDGGGAPLNLVPLGAIDESLAPKYVDWRQSVTMSYQLEEIFSEWLLGSAIPVPDEVLLQAFNWAESTFAGCTGE
jgi:hypothetical protein